MSTFDNSGNIEMRNVEECRIAVLFAVPRSGKLELVNGKLGSSGDFNSVCRVEVDCREAKLSIGSYATVGSVRFSDLQALGFSFFLRDVNSEYPIFLPDFEAAVVPADDPRGYAEVARDVKARGLVDDFRRLETLPEANAADILAEIPPPHRAPTWLGLGRDPRIFLVSPREVCSERREKYRSWGSIVPADHASWGCTFPDDDRRKYELFFVVGPGEHGQRELPRRLLDGWLPILTSRQDEGGIVYEMTAFATCEDGPIAPERIRGATADEAYSLGIGKPVSREEWVRIMTSWRSRQVPETVCAIRIVARNIGKTPEYAYFKAPQIAPDEEEHTFHGGLSCSERFPGKCVAACQIDGAPMPNPEMAVLTRPGSSVEMVMWIPHQPIAEERAERLLEQDFEKHLEAAVDHWRGIAKTAADFSIPEKPIAERVKAGLPHLEILLTGPADDSGPLLANCGIYTPIGTESSPIIQYLDSLGLHDQARRCIDFFLDLHQREDGFIRAYSDYDSETAPVLWTAAEHFRYTRDLVWLERQTPKLKRACDFLLRWRNRNKTEDARARGGWGLASGKVADPKEYYHSFFLNALNFMGLSSMAEVLRHTAPEYAEMLGREVAEYRLDIRKALRFAIGNAPVIPLADGTWTPAIPGWTEQHGAITLYADGGKWFTHGSFAGRDHITGPVWLIFAKVVEPFSREAKLLLNCMQHPQSRNNAAMSQPYYSRHEYANLVRGEVKLFLQAFYRQMAAIQDRETYTFWEHYYMLSSHKTHEEGWFLMQTRWMFYLETGDDHLRLFAGAPRIWFAPGEKPGVTGAASTLGHLDFHAECETSAIICRWRMERPIRCLEIRLPHPEGKTASAASVGTYDPATESVKLENPPLEGEVKLVF